MDGRTDASSKEFQVECMHATEPDDARVAGLDDFVIISLELLMVNLYGTTDGQRKCIV